MNNAASIPPCFIPDDLVQITEGVWKGSKGYVLWAGRETCMVEIMGMEIPAMLKHVEHCKGYAR